jgi:lysophospholipase L1-like esterase
MMTAFDMTYNSIDEIAQHKDLLVVDMDQSLSGKQEYFEDGIHFTSSGSRAASKLVATAIEPLINHVVARKNFN